MSRGSLVGRQVLLTRPGPQAQSSIDAFSRRGASVVVIPLIAIEPVPLVDTSVLERINSFDLVVFTSANAVRTLAVQTDLRRIRCDVVCVGSGTAHALRDLRIPVRMLPDAAPNSAGLLLELSNEYSLVGKRILFPCSESARNDLPDGLKVAGAKLERLVIYRTVKASFDSVALARDIEAESFDVLLFSSPSAVQVFTSTFPISTLGAARRSLIGAIGDTTAAALVEARLEPGVVSPHPDPESFAAAVARHFVSEQV